MVNDTSVWRAAVCFLCRIACSLHVFDILLVSWRASVDSEHTRDAKIALVVASTYIQVLASAGRLLP